MTARILEGITPDDYHKLPSFSSSTAKTLIAKSPLHAWTQHAAYGAKGKKETKAMDHGSVGHALVLGAGKRFEVLNFDAYRSDKAKKARDDARAAGKVPILVEAFEEAANAAAAVTNALADHDIVLDGQSELAIEWEEDTSNGPLLCRAMFDHVWLKAGLILDLKFTSDAAPTSIERNAENMGYAIQAAAYRRALTALKPELAGRVDFLFAFCEPEEPFAINICRPDGTFYELGERRWNRAIDTWAKCLEENHWPGYGGGVNWITPPAWALAREEYAA